MSRSVGVPRVTHRVDQRRRPVPRHRRTRRSELPHLSNRRRLPRHATRTSSQSHNRTQHRNLTTHPNRLPCQGVIAGRMGGQGCLVEPPKMPIWAIIPAAMRAKWLSGSGTFRHCHRRLPTTATPPRDLQPPYRRARQTTQTAAHSVEIATRLTDISRNVTNRPQRRLLVSSGLFRGASVPVLSRVAGARGFDSAIRTSGRMAHAREESRTGENRDAVAHTPFRFAAGPASNGREAVPPEERG